MDTEFLLGTLYDKAKCFDLVVPEMARIVLKIVGIPAFVVDAYVAFVVNISRFFVIGRWCGQLWKASNSVLQGDALSILVINAFHWFLFQKLRSDVPRVSTTCYIDDLGLRAAWGDRAQLRTAHELTMEFHRVAGFVDNPDKAIVW